MTIPHDPPGDTSAPLAAIIAGGASRRFGARKATARLQGRPLLEWVHAAVAAVLPDTVLITGDAEVARRLGIPWRGDLHAGTGPLGGIHAALRWARELGRPAALCVGCDTPFLEPLLLRRLVERAAESGADALVPASGMPGKVEPLCAVYTVACIAEIERRLLAGEHALGGLTSALRLEVLPLEEVRGFGDPEVMFLNVNTRAQLERAREIAGRGVPHASS